MNTASIIILVLVAAGFAAALIGSRKNRSSCCGNCQSCGMCRRDPIEDKNQRNLP